MIDFLPAFVRNANNKAQVISSSNYFIDLTETEKNILEFYIGVEDNKICFPFSRYSDELGYYYDIIFYCPPARDAFGESEHEPIYYRFIIAEGKRLNGIEEKKLLQFLSEGCLFDTELLNEFVLQIKKNHSEMHMLDYISGEYTIVHLYFSMQQGGSIYEMLFKAELSTIAFGLPEVFEGSNLMELADRVYRSPADFFGMPHRLLKLLNTYWGLEYLKPENRSHAIEVYTMFSSVIVNVNHYSQMQWEYLCWLYDSGEQYDSRIYRYTKDNMYAESVEDYMLFLQRREIVKDYYAFNRFPESPEAYIAASNNVYELYNLLLHEEDYDARINEKQNLYEQYTYTDDEKYMFFPRGLYDLCREAENQKNCLLGYVRKLVDKNDATVILFLREKLNPSKSYITLEIDYKKKILVQAYGTCNRRLNSEEMVWLKKYAEVKQLDIHPNIID